MNIFSPRCILTRRLAIKKKNDMTVSLLAMKHPFVLLVTLILKTVNIYYLFLDSEPTFLWYFPSISSCILSIFFPNLVQFFIVYPFAGLLVLFFCVCNIYFPGDRFVFPVTFWVLRCSKNVRFLLLGFECCKCVRMLITIAVCCFFAQGVMFIF